MACLGSGQGGNGISPLILIVMIVKIGLCVFFGRKYIHSPPPNDDSGCVTASAMILVTP